MNNDDRLLAYNKTKEYMIKEYSNNKTLLEWIEEIENEDKRV